ncbi:DEKNAAC103031 [Brettanomyces naardenensis]|uniref:DEKNAAC103031 n=1 Tax=Brettanomyces naardenensis TaxID=13370 RepID=A0A448YMC3_BRENA|nr:DEKNAAC103031 [Brettanomyces naardenensis]
MLRRTTPLRYFATSITNSSVKRLRHRKLNDDISFEDFILKGQVLQTYRDMLRTLQKIPDASARTELHDFVKSEFKAAQNTKDVHLRRSQLIGGIREFKSLTNSLGLSMPEIDFVRK